MSRFSGRSPNKGNAAKAPTKVGADVRSRNVYHVSVTTYDIAGMRNADYNAVGGFHVRPLSYPLIFSKAKMQLVIGALPR